MLTVYTSTCCRPDYVQLLAWCLRRTLVEPYRFVVIVHPGGLRRDWDGVDQVVDGTTAGYEAWTDAIPMVAGPSVIIHDDCVPVLRWDSAIFPKPHCMRAAGHTVQYHAGPFRPPAPVMKATRIMSPRDCRGWWSDELCQAAAAAQAEAILSGTFLHIDKGTIASPGSAVNATKPRLVEAIAEFVGCDVPEPLTAAELAAHPGREWKSKPGLGDMVAAGLDAVGITKDRVQAVARRVGIKDCGCKRRQQRLNELGETLGIGR